MMHNFITYCLNDTVTEYIHSLHVIIKKFGQIKMKKILPIKKKKIFPNKNKKTFLLYQKRWMTKQCLILIPAFESCLICSY